MDTLSFARGDHPWPDTHATNPAAQPLCSTNEPLSARLGASDSEARGDARLNPLGGRHVTDDGHVQTAVANPIPAQPGDAGHLDDADRDRTAGLDTIGGDHWTIDAQRRAVTTDPLPAERSGGSDHRRRVHHSVRVAPDSFAAQSSRDIHTGAGGDEPGSAGLDKSELANLRTLAQRALPARILTPELAQIIELWRQRQDLRRAEQSLNLRCQAICRRAVGGDKGEAKKLWRDVQKGAETADSIATIVEPYRMGMRVLDERAHALELQVAKIVRKLPLWTEWGAHVRGLGQLTLGALLAEAGGDLADYRGPAALWKRMGLAVIDGKRQRRVADAEGAIRQGYAPQRAAFCLGTLGPNMMKAQGTPEKGNRGPYRLIYEERKAATADRDSKEWNGMRRMRDAQRVMVKRLLQDAWCASRALRRGQQPALRVATQVADLTPSEDQPRVVSDASSEVAEISMGVAE